jgi:hypothetical protein
MKKSKLLYRGLLALAGICLTIVVLMYINKETIFYEGLRSKKSKKLKKKRKQKYMAVDDDDNDLDEDDEKTDPNKLKVPQFQQGPMDGPVNSNTSSVGTNSTNVQTNTNAQNDCYATNSC